MRNRHQLLLITALGIACAVYAACGKVEEIGRSWVLRYEANISELRDTNPTLFARTGSGEIEVMKQVETCSSVSDDCLVFTSFVDGEYYFACSGRRPVRIQTTALRGRATLAVDDTSVKLTDNAPGPPTTLVFSIEEARRSALQQPLISRTWRASRPVNEIIPKVLR